MNTKKNNIIIFGAILLFIVLLFTSFKYDWSPSKNDVDVDVRVVTVEKHKYVIASTNSGGVAICPITE